MKRSLCNRESLCALPAPWRWVIRVLPLALMLAPQVGAQAPLPRAPVKDRTINAGDAFLEEGAEFGRWFGTGPLGGPLDTVDDVVICATAEPLQIDPEDPEVLAFGVSAAYAFENALLAPVPLAQSMPPAPAPTMTGIGLGILDVEIGNVREAGFANLSFIAAAHVGESLSGVNGIGAVDVYDTTGAMSPDNDPKKAVLDLVPPLDPSVPGGCPGDVTPAARFGHSIAIADVDGDGRNDLIVGASSTSEDNGSGDCSRTLHGRVYIFFGHEHFFDEHYPGPSSPKGYLWRWIAIKAPQVDPANPQQFVTNGEFGLSVDADDLDGDGKADVLAGRGERLIDRGRAHLFFGSWIRSQLPPETYPPLGFALLIEPPHAANKQSGVAGAYETLIDTDPLTGNDGFGFNVFMLGRDVGSCDSGCDGRKDIAIFSFFGDFLGSPQNPQPVADAGALFIFFNDSDGPPWPSMTLVNENAGVKIQRPRQAGVPQFEARFGFVVEAISWATVSGTPELATYLLIGEPYATHAGKAEAGRVYMLGTPIDPTAAPDEHLNLLGAPMTDPEDLQRGARYGSCIATLDYAVDPALYPGQEFIVGSRGKNVTKMSGETEPSAGQAYSYRSAP